MASSAYGATRRDWKEGRSRWRKEVARQEILYQTGGRKKAHRMFCFYYITQKRPHGLSSLTISKRLQSIPSLHVFFPQTFLCNLNRDDRRSTKCHTYNMASSQTTAPAKKSFPIFFHGISSFREFSLVSISTAKGAARSVFKAELCEMQSRCYQRKIPTEKKNKMCMTNGP